MDNWDPRRRDYESSFNTYDRGPGRNLPRTMKKPDAPPVPVQLFINGVPRELTEEGLWNLFVKAGNVTRVKKPPPKNENQETQFAFVTMGSVREAEEAIRRYNGFRIERHILKVHVALSEEDKKKRQQQKQEDEEFYNSLTSFKGKPDNLKLSDSDSDIDQIVPMSDIWEKKMKGQEDGLREVNSKAKLTNGQNGPSEKTTDPAPLKGKGRGKVLEELSGLYGTVIPGLGQGQQRSPRQQASENHAVGPGGAADELKTLNERFCESAPAPQKKLSPGESYNVEDLTITIADPCDRGQHSVTTKGEEIKLKHAANKPPQLIKSQPKLSNPSRGMGRGQYGEGMGRGGGGYGQGAGPQMYGQGQPFPTRGGYQPGPRGNRGRGFDRGFDRYESYTSGYSSDFNENYGPMYGRQNGPMYDPGPSYGAYGPPMPAYGPHGHGPAGPGGYHQMPGAYHQDPYRGYQSQPEPIVPYRQPEPMGPYGQSFLLTPAPPLLQTPAFNQSMISPAPSSVMNRPAVTASAAHSPTVSVIPAEEKIEGQNCSVCEKIGHSRCGRCKVPYCSKECQTADWPRHKGICKDIKKGQDQVEEFERNFDVTVGDEMIQNVKGLVERFTGDEVEVTKKASPKSADQQPRKETDKDKGKPQTSVEKIKMKDSKGSGQDGPQNERQQSGKQGDRDRSQQNDRRGKQNNLTCHNCRQTGHFSRECPNREAVAKDITCYNCGKKGHYRGDCPNTEKRARGSQDSKSDSKTVNKKAPVEQEEPEWDEPDPSKLEKPLAQSTPSNSTKTTPAKPVVPLSPRDKGAVPLSPRDKGTAEQKVRIDTLRTATLPLNKEMLVVVTEVVSPSMIWVQIVDKDNVEPLQDIMGKMGTKYKNSKPDLPAVRTGQYCGVQFSLDQQWYRGRVVVIESNEEYLVQFIDFGNKEKRKLSDLREIEEAWLEHPAQAVHCYLEDTAPPGSQTNYSGPADKYQAVITPNIPYKVTAKTQREGEYGLPKYGVVMINQSDENMADRLVEAGLIKKKQSSGMPATGLKQAEEKSPVIMLKELGTLATQVKVGQEIYIMITDALSPANFTVHIIEDEAIAAFKKFSEQLKTVEKDPPYRPTATGELVVAKFSIDGSWYRAEVLKTTDVQVEVTYIDFGNSEAVELNNVRKPKPFCKSLPPQAMKCCLSDFNLPQNEEAAQKVLMAFVELVSLASPVKLRAIVKSVKDDVVMLEVFSAENNKKSVNSELNSVCNTTNEPAKTEISAEAAGARSKVSGQKDMKEIAASSKVSGQEEVKEIPESQLPLDGTTVVATVFEIESVHSFYVQPAGESAKSRLEALMKELNTQPHNEDVAANEIHVGDFVAAQFNDGASLLWYRAKVLELISDKVKVLYVDYGNSDTVSRTSVKKLDPLLMLSPAMAIHCELLGSEGADPDIMEDFKYMLNQTLNVKAVLCRNNLHIVELLLPNEEATSVNETLGLDIDINKETLHQEVIMSKFPVFPLPLDGSKVGALVVDVQRLDLFHIHLTEDKVRLQLGTLMKDLNESCMKDVKPHWPRDRECIAAQFNDGETTLWYRALSLDKDTVTQGDDTYPVQFVDYGNTDKARKEAMRVLDPEFVKVPALAVKCKLSGCTGNESKEKVEEFKSVMYESVPVKIRALRLTDDIYEVEMFLDSDKVEKTDVSDILGLKQATTEVEKVKVEPTLPAAKPKQEEALKQGQSQIDLKQVEFPLDGSTVKRVVVFIENLQSFYVQPPDQELQLGLAQMMKELNESGISTEKSFEPALGEVVAAQYTEGGLTMWYRARVTKMEATKIQVFFVDYGNTEYVKKEEVQRLDEKFMRLPQMAVKCRLVGSAGIEDPELLSGFSCLLNQTLSVKALKRAGEGYEIDLITDEGQSISGALGLSVESSNQVAVPQQQVSPVQQTAKVESEKTRPRAVQQDLEIFKLPLDGSVVPGAVTAIESLQCFDVQILSEELVAQLCTMIPELNDSCAVAARPYTPVVGEIVAAQFTDGGETAWYRARISQILGENVEVFFVDYGRTELVTKQEICRLEDKFLKVPQAAVKCKLAGCTGNEDEQLLKDFELVLTVKLMIKAVEFSNGVYAIELLTNDGISINEKLIPPLEDGSAQARPVSPKVVSATTVSPGSGQEALPRKSVSPQQGRSSERKVVFTQTLQKHVPMAKEFQLMITSVTSPDLFHAQMKDLEHDYQTDLALQTHRMMLECESELGQKDINYEVGELCCAKFKSDNNWYRASILKVYPDKSAQVEFVDYGNTELVPLSMIRPITNDYVELPVLAFRCSLAGVYPVGESWSNESSDKLKVFMNKLLSATLVDVHKDVYTVKLVELERKADVGEMLIKAGVASETQGAVGTQAVSPGASGSVSGADADRLQRENELMRQQLKAMEAQMAELLKQKR